MSAVRTGLDRIAAQDPEALRWLRGKRLGLLAHAASVDHRLRHIVEILREVGADLRALFAPEHGFDAVAQDMEGIEGADAPREGLRLYSLYGESEAELSPKPEWLSDLDGVIVDLQDVGARYYTFVWTAALLARAALEAGVEVLILDRPNPLGGEIVEGMPQRPGYLSFVGLHPVAVRHGMTLAEICRLALAHWKVDAPGLHCLKMLGWRRAMSWPECGLPWVFPSPNMPSLSTARVYPGGCLLEGTLLSEGRGHTRPFEVWGAPYVDGERLQREVPVEGATLRPLFFRPKFHKFAGEVCGGVQVHVHSPQSFRPYATYLRLIAAAKGMGEGRFAWRSEPYEFVHDRPAIDLLTGGPEYREALDAGESLDAYLELDARDAARFAEQRLPFLLYP